MVLPGGGRTAYSRRRHAGTGTVVVVAVGMNHPLGCRPLPVEQHTEQSSSGQLGQPPVAAAEAGQSPATMHCEVPDAGEPKPPATPQSELPDAARSKLVPHRETLEEEVPESGQTMTTRHQGQQQKMGVMSDCAADAVIAETVPAAATQSQPGNVAASGARNAMRPDVPTTTTAEVAAVTPSPCAVVHPSGHTVMMDGETEVDDVLLAACFASRDASALDRIRDEAATRPKPKLGVGASAPPGRFDLDALLAASNLQVVEDNSDSDDDVAGDVVIAGVRMDETVMSGDEDETTKDDTTAKHGRDFGVTPVTVENLPEMLSSASRIMRVGAVCSLVGSLLLVQADMGTRPLDLGAVLCTEARRVLGPISDTFGPVSAPFYVVCLRGDDEPGEAPPAATGDSVYVDLESASYLVDANKRALEYLHGGFSTESDEENDDEDHPTKKTGAPRAPPRTTQTPVSHAPSPSTALGTKRPPWSLPATTRPRPSSSPVPSATTMSPLPAQQQQPPPPSPVVQMQGHGTPVHVAAPPSAYASPPPTQQQPGTQAYAPHLAAAAPPPHQPMYYAQPPTPGNPYPAYSGYPPPPPPPPAPYTVMYHQSPPFPQTQQALPHPYAAAAAAVPYGQYYAPSPMVTVPQPQQHYYAPPPPPPPPPPSQFQ